MAPLRTMAKRLQQLRALRGLSQRDLAQRAGISREYIARLETARQDPTLRTLEKLAKALRVRVSTLLGE